MNDPDLIRVLTQILYELREMNGKDPEGNRKPPVGPWSTPQPYPTPYPPTPLQPYWNTVTASDGQITWLINDHQGEIPPET